MRPEHFHYLLEINRCRSISSAARALHMSQTTLSSIVKAAEAELCFPIFQRTPNGVTTTTEGERLMALAWKIDVKYEELLSLKDQEGGEMQTVTVLMSPSVNEGLAVSLSKEFYRFELHGNLAFEEWPGMQIGPRILQSAANIGVSYLSASELESFRKDADKHKIKIEPLLRDKFYLLVAREHWLAGRESVSMEEINGERMATVTSFCSNASDPLWRAISSNCLQTISYPNISVMEQAVRTQGMIGLLTGYAIRYGDRAGQERYDAIPIEMSDRTNQIYIYLLRRGDRGLRYQEKILVTCIKEHFLACSKLAPFRAET